MGSAEQKGVSSLVNLRTTKLRGFDFATKPIVRLEKHNLGRRLVGEFRQSMCRSDTCDAPADDNDA